MNRKILISGAGIAGPALAFWLHRFGFEATVIERAPVPRRGGQAIDLRGAAVDVLKAMGLHETVTALRTHMRGASVLDAEGNEIGRSQERSFSGGRFDSGDIELFRDDLVEVLYGATVDVEYLWHSSISAIEQSTDFVDVQFEDRRAGRFDWVIGADGLHSNVRRMVFGEETSYVHPFGIALAIFTTPNLLGLRDWQVSYRDATSGYVIYPNRENTQLRVNLGFAAHGSDVWRMPVEDQKRLVAQNCRHLGWEIPRLLEAMRSAPDFYFGDVAQTRMSEWSRGRVALLGDAAFCPSPFSGQGTSLAMVGAFVLAREIASSPADPSVGFSRYESRMRPFVELNQALVDPKREGPIPDETMDHAKCAIGLADLGEPGRD